VGSIASFPKSEKERDKTKYNQNNISTLKKKSKFKEISLYTNAYLYPTSQVHPNPTLVLFCVAMVDRSQSAVQIRHYTIIEVKELLNGSSTRLLVLNTDLEAT